MQTIYDFYDPQLYDARVGDADDSPSTIQYYAERLSPSPKRIVDVGAGTGRLAIPLLKQGHCLTCIDGSQRMLDALLQNALRDIGSAQNLSIVCNPVQEAVLDCGFDAVVAPDDFLLHLLSPEDLSLFFRRASSWLRPRGRVITDVRPRDAEKLRANSEAPFTVRTFGVVANPLAPTCHYSMLYWEQFDVDTQLLTTTCHYYCLDSTGQTTRDFVRILRQRVYQSGEIIRAAAASGLSLVGHTERTGSNDPTDRAIGGRYEFVLG